MTIEKVVREAMVWSRRWTDQEPLTDQELDDAVRYFVQDMDLEHVVLYHKYKDDDS